MIVFPLISFAGLIDIKWQYYDQIVIPMDEIGQHWVSILQVVNGIANVEAKFEGEIDIEFSIVD